jgi:aquaporin Z
MQNKLIAEGFGTFTLAFAVLASLQMENPAVATPVLAALVLALFVYTIGSKSGSHINPAVTLGLWSINKIKTNEALSYIVAQLIGGFLAMMAAGFFLGTEASIDFGGASMSVLMAEAIGTIFFGFGIAAVVYGNVKDMMSGVVIGGSLLLGIMFAMALGSGGALNPAVALAVGTFNLSYILGSVLGSMIGMNMYRRFIV